MSPEEKIFLDDMAIYIKPSIVNKYHNSFGEHTRFYYYRDRIKTFINAENIFYDKEVSSTLSYKKNAFYKMTHLSKEDPFFDFYFTLKHDSPSLVVKKNERKGYHQRKKCTDKSSAFGRENGNFVVNFN